MANQESLDQPHVEVVMVPLPAQGHLNQFLQLSHVISAYNIKVHYVASALHISQAKSRAANYQIYPNNPSIEFHSFPTPDFLSPPPSNPGFPAHIVPCLEATEHLREPMKSLLSLLTQKTTRLVVIHDTLMSHVVRDANSLPNAELYFYSSVSAAFRISCLLPGYDLAATIGEGIPSLEGIWDTGFQDFFKRHSKFRKTNKNSGILFNTCSVLEGQTLDLFMEKERETDPGLKVWVVGPLETMTVFKKKRIIPNSNLGHECLEWLDQQEPRSVLYVSFGTTTFMVDDQIEELAKGLEEGGTKFIWVLKDADRGNIFEASEGRRHKLPMGFEARTVGSGIGMVVRDWAPQMEILGHPSTGGFMSHCGWGSCMESLALGVPLLTWPMHTDQPINAFLVTRVLKVGLVVGEWEKRAELVGSSVIGGAVKSLMRSLQGMEVRKRAEELGSELRKASEEGGVARLELDLFIAHITRD